jgi:Domain of unknown function (DUF4333)
MPATIVRMAASGGPIPTSGRGGRLATTITLLLAAAVLAGCTITIGGRDTVDPASMSDSITRWLKEQFPDLRVGAIECPSKVKLTAGETFQCTADVEGAQLPITVTLTHVDNKGGYDSSFKPAKAIINTDEAVKELQSNLPVELANATVDCGTPRLRVLEVGGTAECTVSKGNERYVVRVVVEDVGGSARLELVDQPPTRPEVATGKIGDKLTVYDEFGDAQLEVTVTRVKFTRGDEFERPRRGLYMGAYVKAHALADDQDMLIYARLGGHLYEEAITGSLAFDPLLGPVVLNRGERTSGWVVFDVPTRHGQLVLRNLDEKTVGIWKY